MRQVFFIRFLSLFAILIILLPIFGIYAAAINEQPSMDNVDSVCVVNAEHKKIVLRKDEHKVIYPASTVKLMTALVAHEAYIGRLTETVTVTREMLNATTGRYLGFAVGEAVSVEHLLYALLIGGYNDAANILAFAVAGGIPQFCQLMNQKAAALGMSDTSYTNPTGLHDAQMVTTAYDTVLLALEFLNNGELFPITKAIKHELSTTGSVSGTVIYNRNYLITTSMTEDYYYSYAEGMNAGATDEAGDCVVTAGRLDGLTYVCVVMGGRGSDPDVNYAYKVAKTALRYALVSFSVIKLKAQKSTIATLPIEFSAVTNEVDVKMTKDLSALIYSGIDVDKDVRFETELYYEKLEAPFEEGLIVGRIWAYYNDILLDECELVTEKAVDSHGFLVFMYKMKRLTQNPLFLIPFLAVCGVFIFYKIKTSGGKKQVKRRKRRYYY